MNKRTRLIVSVLFVAIIVLAAAIVRFYVNVPDNMQNDNNQAEIINITEKDGSGSFIFSDGNGNFGISDNLRITAVPEWQEIRFAEEGICIATKKIGGEFLSGCIDYDGNVVIPLIYRNIIKHSVNNFTVYCAESYTDNSYVLYNQDFMPVFRCSWDTVDFVANEIILARSKGVYIFSAEADGLIFKSASVSGEVMDCPYNLNIYSRVLLSKLSPSMIEKMTGDAEKYLEYAYTGNEDIIAEISSEKHSAFIPAFNNDQNIISRKLLGISDIHIYSVSSDDGIPHYDVSVNADTEIVYYDEYGKRNSLYDNYRIAVNFSGSSESDLCAVSGKFELSSPIYPEPVTENPGQDMLAGD